ncbi:hypothetical protein [Catellatospora sp. NPDC049609]|uniref:hypothetical protein n=1 Tax=Catellatospora sp. NPDC049609 TaxID=3155505 RepID=UPI0034444D54
MHPGEPVDPVLTALLGPAAAAALATWARLMRVRLVHERTLVNGRSGATVAEVYELRHDGTARKLILKHDAVDADAADTAEHARQVAAREEAPDGFRDAHLGTPAHEPVHAGGAAWITFQEVVGGGPEPFHVLTSLLAGEEGAVISGLTVEPVGCPREAVTDVCVDVAHTVLAEWARRPVLARLTASEFVRRHLDDRMEPGRALYELSHRWPGPTVLLPDEPAALPNPFRFATGLPPELDGLVLALLGRGHGDLHTENILVSEDRKRFVLIDLARYRADAPLTQDPLYLVLSVVNRTLDELGGPQRRILLDAFTEPPANVRWSMLPPWLTDLIRRVGEAELRWIGQSGFGGEWRRIRPLSVLAVALLFAARRSTSDPEWFLRLAARAARGHLGSAALDHRPASPPDGPVGGLPSRPGPADTGLGDLCRNMLVKRRKADAAGRGEQFRRLVDRARLGDDVRAAYEALMAAIGHEDRRGPLPGLAGGGPAGHESFHCPLGSPCARVEGRGPRGETPVCFVQYGEMNLVVEPPG